VDAIVGAAKQMHTIIAKECTGCELCVEPCPVDCIEMIAIEPLCDSEQKEKSSLAKQRFLARNQRLQSLQQQKKSSKLTVFHQEETLLKRQAIIQEALARVQRKKEMLK
jgi:electron transport complex protein RnfB